VRFQRVGYRSTVRLMSGEPLMETPVGFLEREQIEFANLSAPGSVRWARLAYWNMSMKKYEAREFDEQLELVSFRGNAALKDDQPFVHLHGVFGLSDFTVIGAHIQEATVHPSLEVWRRTEDVPVRRAKDPSSGLDLLDLPEGTAC
jgi:predicted DNA-binding protein with PD1-like motif